VIPHVAISVGHRRNAQGASYAGMTEWLYNSTIADMLKEELVKKDLVGVIVTRPERASYRGTGGDRTRVSPYMRQIDDVTKTGAMAAIDLHLNAAESKWARGRLILSSGSTRSLLLGRHLRTALNAKVPAQDRGVQTRPVGENGGAFLHVPPMPCVIMEPWFLSNAEDRQDLVWYQSLYVEALADGLRTYFSALGAL
tara:strand:+ start:7252 stop:7842 length:591 start_codon:yes stop_codon:yes gene_type:complete